MKTQFRDLTQSKSCDHCGVIFCRDKRSTWKYWSTAKFCSKKCSAQHGAKVWDKKIPDINTAFYKRAIVGKKNQCWSWVGCTDKDGYPLVNFKSKSFRASRIAIIVSGREIRDDEQACHKCGNKSCVNPDHIYAGTATQNNQDKIAHGTHLQGEKCHTSKLKSCDVMSIRKSNDSNKDLANFYGVNRSNISMIKRRKTWRHLP